MSKAKISVIVLALVAIVIGIWSAVQISQKKHAPLAAVVLPHKENLKETTSTTSRDTIGSIDTIHLKMDLFQKKPSFVTLLNVENVIQQQLPQIQLEQRYQLLERWYKVLVPLIGCLDPQQKKLLSIYQDLEDKTFVDGESAADSQKRLEKALATTLNAKQKTLFQQLTYQQIEIREAEEIGPVFHLKTSYWKNLFAPHLLEADQKYWEQQAIENEPTVDFDAGLAIDRKTLGDWAFSREQYLKRYPKSHYQKEAKENYRSDMSYIVVGLENTSTLDSETKTIDPDVEADFDAIIKRYPNSHVANTIAVFRDKLKEKLKVTGNNPNLYNLADSVIKNVK